MKWLSRKLIVTVLTALLTPIFVKFGIPDEILKWLLGLIAVYLGGQSTVDALAALRGTAEAAAIAKGGGAAEVKAIGK